MSSIAFDKSLILKIGGKKTNAEVLSEMTDYLCEKGIVKDTYKQAILDREQNFPTGLETGGINIAIPHTDVCHVKEAAICVGILDTPASFRAMDEPDQDLPIHLVIMLALTETHGHIEMLQKIVELIQNREDVKRIIEAEDLDTVNTIITDYLL